MGLVWWTKGKRKIKARSQTSRSSCSFCSKIWISSSSASASKPWMGRSFFHLHLSQHSSLSSIHPQRLQRLTAQAKPVSLFLNGRIKRNSEWMRENVLLCLSTFTSQTSRAGPRRGEEWSGDVETVLQRGGKEGVEVCSIHIRFELSSLLTALQLKQSLLALTLDIPKHKISVSGCHRRRGSHYVCQITVHQVVNQCTVFAPLQCIRWGLTKHVLTQVPMKHILPTCCKIWQWHSKMADF